MIAAYFPKTCSFYYYEFKFNFIFHFSAMPEYDSQKAAKAIEGAIDFASVGLKVILNIRISSI